MFRTCLLSLTFILMAPPSALSQIEPATLEVETANLVIYRHDVADAARFSTEAGPTSPLALRTFMNVTWIGDIVAVNGSPAKGTLTVRGTFVGLNPNPAPGTGIADTTNSLASDWIFDIQRPDGSPVGTIIGSGWAFGARAAGLPAPGQGNLAILGGTGAFLGVRGQAKEAAAAAGARSFASVAEDPANRRIHGGRAVRYMLQLLPAQRPDFARPANSGAIFHSDFSPVTVSNPARRGEALIASASGLGPTLPGLQPGATFPEDALQQVAAPIQVRVNGVAVDTFNQVGWPGTSGTYRVDFRLPDGIPAGTTSLQLVVAWIPGSVIEIPVQ
jgi:hypothetical protein